MRGLLRMFFRRVLVWAMLAGFVVIPAFHVSVAEAATTNVETLVRKHATTIPKEETVEDVLVLGHNVLVEGKVTEILVVLDGNVHLDATSRTRIVVDIGGTITQSPGAHVDAVYHATLNSPFWDGTLFGGAAALLVWASTLAVSLGMVILAVLISLAFGSSPVPLAAKDKSVRRIGLLGFFVSVAALAVSSLLAVTIVALPFAALLLTVYVVAGVIGFSATSVWIGRLAQRQKEVPRPVWQLALIGSSLIVAFTNVPIIGMLLFAILWLIGIGTVTAWIRQIITGRKRR